MLFGKIVAYISLAIAIMASIKQEFTYIQLIAIEIIIVLCCFGLEWLLKKISNLNYKWLDALFFTFSKNPNNFIIKNKIITFDIKSVSEAQYHVEADVIQTKRHNKAVYQGRYSWPQEKDIEHIVCLDNNKLDTSDYEIGEHIKWSTVKVFTSGIIHKGDENKIKYSLNNLYINNIKYHRFLSCKVIEKIIDLKLNIKIPVDIAGQNKAEFLIENEKGEIIHSEELSLPGHDNMYSHTIHKPRIGRKYIIKIS